MGYGITFLFSLIKSGGKFVGTKVLKDGKLIANLKDLISHMLDKFKRLKPDEKAKVRDAINALGGEKVKLNGGVIAWIKANPWYAFDILITLGYVSKEAGEVLVDWAVDPSGLDIGDSDVDDKVHELMPKSIKISGESFTHQEEYDMMVRLLNGEENLHMLKRVIERLD